LVLGWGLSGFLTFSKVILDRVFLDYMLFTLNEKEVIKIKAIFKKLVFI